VASPIRELTQEALDSSSFCNCTWKDVVAIAISIVGIVASIFTQSMLGLAGFILCGVLFLAKKYEHTTSISDLENEIKNILEQQEENFSKTEMQMEKQIAQIEADRNDFAQKVHQLELDNQTLENIQKGFKEEEAKLEEANAALEREKEDLTHILEAEKANANQIRADVQAIISENLRFGTTTGLFEQNVESLKGTKEQLEKQLEAFVQEFDGDLKTLSEQIQIAKETSKQLADSAVERTEELETTLKTLQESVNQRQEVEEEVKRNIAALVLERERIEKRTNELSAKEATLRALEVEIDHEREEFQKTIPLEREALEHQTEELRVQKQQLNETAQQLNEMVRLKAELIAGYDRNILAKQREYQELKTLIATSKT